MSAVELRPVKKSVQVPFCCWGTVDPKSGDVCLSRMQPWAEAGAGVPASAITNTPETTRVLLRMDHSFRWKRVNCRRSVGKGSRRFNTAFELRGAFAGSRVRGSRVRGSQVAGSALHAGGQART